MSTEAIGKTVRSVIPARLDRLPWSPFHTRLVLALGVAWVLDGLEITVASAIAETLTEPTTLGLSSAAVGLIATVYLIGEVVGALFFGRLSDRLGRRKLFMITLGIYLGGSGLTALTLGSGPGLDRLPVCHPVHRRDGHRRRVRRDQLRHRRADPGPVPRPDRHRGQRKLLVRRHSRHARHVDPAQRVRSQRRLAARLPDRPGPWAVHPGAPPAPAGKPTLADHARPGEGGRRRRSTTSRRRWRPAVSSSPRSTIRRPSNCARNAATATSRCCGCCSRPTRSDRFSAPP